VKTSKIGIDLMHHFEGYRNKPYLCPANIWTIGFGRVLYQEQIRLPMVRKEGYTGLIRSDYQLKGEDNRVWSKEELVDLFKVDINSFERGVLRLSPNLVSHQSKFDAVVSFAYNAGLGNYQRSTIRMKVNREDWTGASEAFMSWTKAGGKEVSGLVKRRKAEVALFLS
jgi:GH24 family phage-related lysozyme (muramidase)